MKINHIAIDPQMEKCVSQVQWLVMSPAFKQTVTTTYCNREKEKNRNPLTKVEFLPKQVMKVHINELCLEITAKLVKRVKKSQMLCHFHFFFKMFRNTTNQQKNVRIVLSSYRVHNIAENEIVATFAIAPDGFIAKGEHWCPPKDYRMN